MKNLEKLSDENLVKLLTEGKVTAFDELYNRYWDKLYSSAAKRVNESEIAEEIVQDFFTSLWVNREKLTIRTSFSSYVYSSVKYLVFNHYQKESVRKSYQEQLLQKVAIYDNSTEDQITYKELNQIIDTEVKTLPAKCRSVFELSRKEYKNNKEIALILGISEKTVENHLTKALRNLRLSVKDVISLFIILFRFFL
jgi:RNA polymerase sigma-70 factor (family 1)